jgi:hypothetical protein
MNLKLSLLSLATITFSISFGQIKLEDLKVDTTITGFHFAADFQGTIVFTKHGPSDLHTKNPTAFSFTLAPNMTFTNGKSQLNHLLNMSRQIGFEINDFIEKDTIIKGNYGYYISYTETYDKNNYKNFVFYAFVIKDKTLIIFTSGDLDNGMYIDKFKKTFYTIKL